MEGSKECNEVYPERWSSYETYRLTLFLWLLNDISVVISPVEVSHNAFFVHSVLQTLSIIFVGIPLLYSEICIAQYTNCDFFSMWNFCPFFRPVGYGTIYIIILKLIYLLVLASWFLMYTFYSTLDPPPWFSCDSFPNELCMVKRLNVSIFQHCLESQILFDVDCGMKTASNYFFEQELGRKNTLESKYCALSWKPIVATSVTYFFLLVVSLKNKKLTQLFAKLNCLYVCLVLFMLSTKVLSKGGTWYSTSITLRWSNLSGANIFKTLTRGFLSVGTGTGIVIFLSRDVPFRSPANMTAIISASFSNFICTLLSLVAYSGIKTMSYYHSEEETIIEIGDSFYFQIFASMSEILSYFDHSLWTFAWFSIMFLCLFGNIWILFLFIESLIRKNKFVQKYSKLSFLIITVLINVISWPFHCSDVASVLSDAIDIIQTINNIFFALSLYWIYGYKNHIVDIIFMLGIRVSYYWKITWVICPIILTALLYFRWKFIEVKLYDDSYHIEMLSMTVDCFTLYVALGVYFAILIIGTVIQLMRYHRVGTMRDLFKPTKYWGPRDIILLKSRIMFVPEIMTTEFLYRRVRIRGYCSKSKSINKLSIQREVDTEHDETEWSPMTSN